MEEAEFYSFMLPPDPWRKKPSPSTFKMTMAEAAKRYPGAQPILSSREVRKGDAALTPADSPYAGRGGYLGERE